MPDKHAIHREIADSEIWMFAGVYLRPTIKLLFQFTEAIPQRAHFQFLPGCRALGPFDGIIGHAGGDRLELRRALGLDSIVNISRARFHGIPFRGHLSRVNLLPLKFGEASVCVSATHVEGPRRSIEFCGI